MRNDNLAVKNLKDVNDGKVTSSESSHPLGTTLGTIGGMVAGVSGAVVAGAAMGSTVGPVGGAIGAIVGAAIGAETGHEIAAQINPHAEDLYWRANYSLRSYVTPGTEYATYQPAYHYGIESYTMHHGRSFDEIEPSLGKEWNEKRGNSSLEWDEAKLASRDAYTRLEKSDK